MKAVNSSKHRESITHSHHNVTSQATSIPAETPVETSLSIYYYTKPPASQTKCSVPQTAKLLPTNNLGMPNSTCTQSPQDSAPSAVIPLQNGVMNNTITCLRQTLSA